MTGLLLYTCVSSLHQLDPNRSRLPASLPAELVVLYKHVRLCIYLDWCVGTALQENVYVLLMNHISLPFSVCWCVAMDAASSCVLIV